MPHPLTPTATLIAALGTTLVSTGCSSTPKFEAPPPGPATEMVPAQLDSPAPEPERVEVPVLVTSPQLRPLPEGLSGLAQQQMEPLRAIADGRDEATMDAGDVDGLLAVLRYPYLPGVVYTAVTSPGFVTTIALEPGERLLTAAAGDTTRWLVDAIEAGSTSGQAGTLLMVKPRQPFLQTNLVITTDRRVYHLDLTSVDVPVYNTTVAWDYPRPRNGNHEIIALHGDPAAQEDAALVDTGPDATVSIASLNFDYRIRLTQGSRPPRWMPTRVFDSGGGSGGRASGGDGQKTYIEFAPDLGTTEAPPLFILPDGPGSDEACLVNYRIDGRYYVVDRLFDAAELRLGTPPGEQTVVRIERIGAEAATPRDRSRPSHRTRPIGR